MQLFELKILHLLRIFRSGGSLELTMSGHVRSCHVRLISKKSIIQELHNMVQYPDIEKHSGVQYRSSQIE